MNLIQKTAHYGVLLSIENNKGIADSYPFVHYDGSAEVRTLEPFRVVGFSGSK